MYRTEAEVLVANVYTFAAVPAALIANALIGHRISCRHAICMNVMVLKPSHHDDADREPTPAFASDAEIELAAQLRHELETRLLETSDAPPSSNNKAAKTTATINSTTR